MVKNAKIENWNATFLVTSKHCALLFGEFIYCTESAIRREQKMGHFGTFALTK